MDPSQQTGDEVPGPPASTPSRAPRQRRTSAGRGARDESTSQASPPHAPPDAPEANASPPRPPPPAPPPPPPPSPPRIPSAWDVLARATIKVRQLRWAYGVVGIAAASAIIKGLGVAPGDLLTVATPILAAMLLLFLFSRLIRGLPSVILSWVTMLLLAGSAIGVVSCVFFDEPKPITDLAEQVRIAFRLGDLAPDRRKQEPPKSTPAAATPTEPSSTLTWTGTRLSSTLPERFAQSDGGADAALVRAGELVIDGGRLLFDPPMMGITTKLVAQRITLKNGAQLITNGGSVNLDVGSIHSENGAIVSFPDALLIASSPIFSAPTGRSARQVTLKVRGGISGRLKVDLSGEPGIKGAAGMPGNAGGPGAPGDNSTANALCTGGAGNGAPGRNGENGSPGRSGGQGGDGGDLLLLASASAAQAIDFTSNGGRGGDGGDGGPGGPGGAGGRGGSARFPCVGDGANGPAGMPGSRGPAGTPGGTGRPGSMERRFTTDGS